MICKRDFSSIYRLKNRLKTISFCLIFSEKAPQQISKNLLKLKKKQIFQNCPKRKEPLPCCRLGGRPVRSTASPTGKSRWLSVDRSGRPTQKEETQFPSSGRPVRSTENSREQNALRRSTGPVDRRTCTNSACPDTAPVDRAGRPMLPETEKLGCFELEKF